MAFGNETEYERHIAKTPRRHAEVIGAFHVTWAFSPCSRRSHGLKARVTEIFSIFLFVASWRLGVVAFVRCTESQG